MRRRRRIERRRLTTARAAARHEENRALAELAEERDAMREVIADDEDCGGVAVALRAEADEWPYDDDPPDPL